MINERRGSSHPPARLRKTQKPSSAFRHRKPLWLASACGRFGLYSFTSQNWNPNNTPDSFGRGWALADVQDTPAGDLFYRESCGDICGARTPTQMGYQGRRGSRVATVHPHHANGRRIFWFWAHCEKYCVAMPTTLIAKDYQLCVGLIIF